MSSQTILIVGAVAFTMLLIGLGLTHLEFRRRLEKRDAKTAGDYTPHKPPSAGRRS